jgi:outer membrane protein OmpA-like peptidoglycan-associated protein
MRKNCWYKLFTFLLTIMPFLMQGQEMLGIRSSNYAGLQGLGINPSSMIYSRLKWDINIITVGVSLENDYLFIPRKKLNFFGINNLVNQIEKEGYLDDFDRTDNNLYFSTAVMGPSLMFPVTRKHSFALTSQFRAAISCNGLSPEGAKYAFEEFGFDPLHFINTKRLYDISGVEFNTMAWAEYGLSYATLLHETDKNAIKGGLTLKLLQGIGGGYVENVRGDFNVLNDEDMLFSPLSLNYGRTNYNTFENVGGLNDFMNGYGFAWDLGFTYEWRREPSLYKMEMDGERLVDMEQNKYDVKLGISVIDIGSILYNRNANTFNLSADSAFYPNWDNDEFADNWDFDYSMSEIFYGDRLASLRSNHFRMKLPGAISIQADFRLNDIFFINTTVIQSLRNKDKGVDRPSIYSITPRYETRWLEVALPISFIDYEAKTLRTGLALYLGAFWIGSDKLGSLLGFSDVYGADIYASFKYSIPWSNPLDRDKDKVSDRKDKCIEVPGLFKFSGCPDRDGDDIEDSRDTCPDIPGLPEFNGCPDRDHDKIQDRLDACPDDSGAVEFDGCPDRDGDKIIDLRDSCPDLPGVEEFSGCPDRDGDKIIDPKDDCPDQPGVLLYNGCPDTDGDSIPDPLDRCPLVPGIRTLNGCPEEVKAVKMESVAPQPATLTAEEQEIINTVFKNLQFETGKAIIKPVSFTSMDALAQLMKTKTGFKLIIEGHTDNVGAAAYNLSLSKKRAKAAKDYLSGKGVEESRITTNGYGLTKPISTNKTPEGRAQNRRVVFTIVQ